VEDYEKMYPKRELKEGAIVTRYAPSPTGFVHMGALFASFIERKMARQTGGVFYLRIEDTDKKREIENGIESIVRDLANFGITIDEGVVSETEEKGMYGPYVQSKRKDIYQAFAKHLIENDLAYPCFKTEEELEEIRKEQEAIKDRIGYYGKYAKDRYLTREEVIEKVKNNEKYIIRLKSPGDFNKKFVFEDLVKGKMELPENDLDIIIIKGDGLPTYHFAHLVDDYLMRTTHVIRGDEWLSSIPIHIQLFKVFGFKAPKYAHIAPLLKEENGSRRKLSKRKDPEAAVEYYSEIGIPSEAVMLYLCTVANSNFESWYEQNKDSSIDDFKMEFKKISSSGSLFDLDKLLNISKNYISRLTKEEVYNIALMHSNRYDKELYELLYKYEEYSKGIFNIEREQKKPRKDIAMMSEIKEQIWYMYDELYYAKEKEYEFQTITDLEEIKKIITLFMEKYYNDSNDKDTWFNNIKELSKELGYASEVKAYKENPELYKGHVGDVSTVLRVALTSKSMTPDLYEIMKLFTIDRIKERYNNFINQN
ncbi:MAG TPA: glutamate--tRNA ligase, partial [Tenericutes bacterium]|nr:glutamate--tRNA ligase [Mycoplasmatota bacterium]